MRDTGLRQEKERELFETYLRGLRECYFSSMHHAADWVRSQPASKFYISSKSLSNSIRKIRTGVRKLSPNKSLYDEKLKYLYDMYCDFREQNPDCTLSRERVCELLVECPAPHFYICHDSCLKAILKERIALLDRL